VGISFGSEQEAVALWASILVAVGILGVWGAIARRLLGAGGRDDDGTLGRPPAMPIELASVLAIVGALIALGPLWLLATVAIGYRDAAFAAISWTSAVLVTCILGTLLWVLAVALAMPAAQALRDGSARP
jgi:hypothetical protein